MRRFAVGMVVACLSSIALGASSAAADEASLFSGPGQLPGPSILYKRPKLAPQLTNAPAGVWKAPPILISGASAYRGGEFLYQDFLYDDVGAKGKRESGDPRQSSLFSLTNGTYTYPKASGYANNAADLVEFRVKPLSSETAFRLTFNTLVDPDLTGATIAIGSSSSPRPFPHGANASAPAQLFLTWHGDTADLIDAATGDTVYTGTKVDVDLVRRQVTLRVAHSAWDPGQRTIRFAVAAGLWDGANGRYLTPAASSTADRPGGAGGLTKPTAFFNVAFRNAEPFQSVTDTAALTDPGWWREKLQAVALADGNIARFRAKVSFKRLSRGTDDDLSDRPEGVPASGRMNRILSSRYQTGSGGADFSDTCGGSGACSGELRGRLQPYSIYVPKDAPTNGRYQLTLLLHSLTANYNQFSGTRNQTQFGDRSRPSIVITPEGRGPDGFYVDRAGADTFEVWADVAARFPLDPRRTTVAGYSMGGFGTFKFASQFPDLFARAQPTVGALTIPADMLASVRWIPFLMWNATKDELVPPGQYLAAADKLKALRYRYQLDQFEPFTGALPVPTPNHIMLAANDQFAPAAKFLDAARVVRDPPRVTYVRNAALDFAKAGTRADHAYWVSRIKLRDPASLGTVDVRSRGFGRGDPKAVDSTGSGKLKGGNLGTRPFTLRRTKWGSAPTTARRDVLDVAASNVSSITVDATRARVTCDAKVAIVSKDPVAVRLRNCPRALPAQTSPTFAGR